MDDFISHAKRMLEIAKDELDDFPDSFAHKLVFQSMKKHLDELLDQQYQQSMLAHTLHEQSNGLI